MQPSKFSAPTPRVLPTLEFTKMHGLGNDFVVIDAIRQQVDLTRAQVRLLADRHLGVGCDQVLLIERPTRADADFRYRIFNANGCEVEQCGNGARCFVKFVRDKGLTAARVIRVETKGGLISPELLDNGEVRVDMGVPRFSPADIPFIADEECVVNRVEISADPSETRATPREVVDLTVVSMGNPHAVQVVPDVERAPVTTQGPQLEHHPRFPQGVNAGYMQVQDRANIALRVWERGAGETLACGTGACAAVVAGIRRGLLAAQVKVHTRGGMLVIEWQGENSPVLMTGPALNVFAGEWQVPASEASNTGA